MILLRLLRQMGEEPVTEYRFARHRRWKFDVALPARKIALEIEGGSWINGRHTRAKGYIADLEKYNCAVLLGWRVVRVTPQQVENGVAINLLDALVSAQEVRGGPITAEEASVLFPAPVRRSRGRVGAPKRKYPGLPPRGGLALGRFETST